MCVGTPSYSRILINVLNAYLLVGKFSISLLGSKYLTVHEKRDGRVPYLVTSRLLGTSHLLETLEYFLVHQ